MKVEFRRATSSPSGNHFSTSNNFWDVSLQNYCEFSILHWLPKFSPPARQLNEAFKPDFTPVLVASLALLKVNAESIGDLDANTELFPAYPSRFSGLFVCLDIAVARTDLRSNK